MISWLRRYRDGGDRLLRVLLRYEHLLPIVIGVVYWAISRGFPGPAYQQDEIGYLVNGAFFAGHVIDGYSSYFAGYSLLLAPLFALLGDPAHIWQGVMVVNAILWAGAFFLLARLLEVLAPDCSPGRRFVALALAAVYPAWPVMAGYAFSQSAFVFVFVASALAFVRRDERTAYTVLPFSMWVGFLFWIHPTAIAVCGASVIAIAVEAWRTRKVGTLLVHLTAVLALVVAYKAGVQPWMMHAMTPAGYEARTHYPSAALILHMANSVRFWRDWILVFAGQFVYLIVATFGWALIGLGVWVKAIFASFVSTADGGTARSERRPLLEIYLLVSLLAVMALAATSFASQLGGPNTSDEWFYGRYLEGVLLPLLGLGLAKAGSVKLRLRTLSAIALTMFVVAVFIQSLPNGTTQPNLINVAGFWPYAVARSSHLIPWVSVGALAVLLNIGMPRSAFLIPIVLFAFASMAKIELKWHSAIVRGYSKPTAMVSYVRNNFRKGTCVGFDPSLPQGAPSLQVERIRLYSFYLFDYGYRRMSFSEWDGMCKEGPFFSFSDDYIGRGGVRVLGRESSSGLYLYAHEDHLPSQKMEQTQGGVVWVESGGSLDCLRAGCFTRSALEMVRFSKVGVLNGAALVADGKPGVLFYGPYVPLEKGKYVLKLSAAIEYAKGAVLEVVSKAGGAVHAQLDLGVYPPGFDGTVSVPFELENRAGDLEVRLRIQADSKLQVKAYEVTLERDR